MKKKVLFNTRSKLNTIDLITKYKTEITVIEKPKKIINYSSKLSFKDYIILKHKSSITNPIIKISESRGKIVPIHIEKLLSNKSFMVWKFDIHKENYSDFNKIIYDNIEKLYDRIVRLYEIVKNQMINRYGLSYTQDTYFLNENLFITILSNIETEIKDYSDITDKILISELVKYFRSNL